ncbi:DUF4194 domain-containing protein [Pseudoxanthomonas composti]|uniref:DUF4194 domain-containing protein n=1 Tax=Pseudoxanthomonas composti TaxID=2137479 RepID=A0A4Q1JYH2_9GAMM|nr:DUF4194 domain-containing protein [Pseudoxanthomonas composti]RXR07430.1 DUF4194 domain-containing protein [Pseudoxanthomonas composti]
MKRSWSTLSQQSNGLYQPADFEQAAYRLITEQVLYSSDRGSRVAYALVESYLADFAEALKPFGVQLERNPHHRYVVALPMHGAGAVVTLAETLLALVLRRLYDQGMRRGEVADHGEVMVELADLQEHYQGLTGRALPDVGTLRTLLGQLKRWGIARTEDTDAEDPQPFTVLIRPAIVEVLGEQWLQRLDQHAVDELDMDASAEAAGDDDRVEGNPDVSA